MHIKEEVIKNIVKNHHCTALKYYQKAHELNPRTPIYLVNMGITYYVLNESHKLRFVI